jgi:hypothetical protein
MSELVHERIIDMVDAKGTPYDRAFIYADLQPGGSWRGFIEFVSADGEEAVRTGYETTQSTLEGVAYWATGVESAYIEGAFDRALERADLADARSRPARRAVRASIRSESVVQFSIETLDPEIPIRLMASSTLLPGLRRRILDYGSLVYEGSSVVRSDVPGVYDFVAELTSPTMAPAVLGEMLWNELRGADAILTVEDVEVPIDRGAIKDALTGVAVP